MINYKELKKYIHQYKPGDILHGSLISVTIQKPGGYAFIPPLNLVDDYFAFKYGSKRSMIRFLEWLISYDQDFANHFTTPKTKRNHENDNNP